VSVVCSHVEVSATDLYLFSGVLPYVVCGLEIPMMRRPRATKALETRKKRKLEINILCFLLGNSPASEVYMPTFRNTLSVPSS
jgi:hypothetical protein